LGLLLKRAYGDLRIADGWRTRCRRPAALGALVEIGDGAGGGKRGDGGRRRIGDLVRALRSRSGARPEAKGIGSRGGMRGDGDKVSIVMGLGDGERQGRGPWSVSTMSIRPPQHGQRRAGETCSA
jgi:hypothetical protein